MKINDTLNPKGFNEKLKRFWTLSAIKLRSITQSSDPAQSSPVFTVNGRYTSRGWTEWTQGFEFGSNLLQFDATGDQEFLEIGRQKTLEVMAPHLTHMGVHDHGFNNVSTYGNLLRLMNEGKFKEEAGDRRFYELALKCSGAVQARRWTNIANGEGFIYSFNGPHSLFSDTIRSLRSLAIAHRLGHTLMEENDRKIILLDRLIQHARTTARFNVYYGEGRDAYDIPGRVAHESIFNLNDGNYRCPNSQQGYSPFTTWTRGLAWIMCGFAEQLEFLATLEDINPEVNEFMLRAAKTTCDFYIQQTPHDGIPYWDTGAPYLTKIGDYLNQPADPFNNYEPVDSSAAAIGAQGLLRLGHFLGHSSEGKRYWQAGLTVLDTLLDEPYLSVDEHHQGLILHSIYHRPNGWDAIPEGRNVPCNESSMWGDYHARELALYVQRMSHNEPYLTFWGTQK